jgi:hypothetical protein
MEDDWRLTGQEKYLVDVKLIRRRYRSCATNPGWDHDHCEFCNAKFMTEPGPEVEIEGYCTEDEYRWICCACFRDFRNRFRWTVVDVVGAENQNGAG